MKTAALLFLSVLSAVAGTITLTGVDTTKGDNLAFFVNGVEESHFAGIILANYNGGPTQPMLCVDLFTSISLSTYTSEPRAPLSDRELRAAYLYVTYLSGVSSVVQGQGLQIAIWDIIHDGGNGSGAGIITSSTNTPVEVNTAWANYLALSAGFTSTAASIYLNFDGSTPAQSLIGAFQPTAIPGVPEPATTALVGAALIGCSLYRREKF
jgi:hypothetical protein